MRVRYAIPLVIILCLGFMVTIINVCGVSLGTLMLIIIALACLKIYWKSQT